MDIPQAKKKSGMGCLGSIGLILLTIVVIALVSYPWALHIGGRWTPMIWHGVGWMRSTTGAEYVVYMNIGPLARAAHGGGRRNNLWGNALLCTPQGTLHNFDVSGRVDAWLDADQKQMRLYLTSPKDVKPNLTFHLTGEWKGQELFLEDLGSMTDSFNADGTGKGYLLGKRAPQENAQVTLSYAKQDQFDVMCRARSEKSF